MKITLTRLIYLSFFSWLLSACGTLGAGSHTYCESILLACPSDTLIKRLTLLKTDGRYDNARSFLDGPGEERDAPYSFYFYEQRHNFLVHIEVPVHTPTHTDLHIAGVNYFIKNSKWQLLNQDVTKENKEEVLAWFDSDIRPALTCNSLPLHP